MTQPSQMIQWLVRTHNLIENVDENLSPPEQIGQFEDLNRDTFALLREDERKGVLKYFWPRDAAMSLVSHIAKHLIISESTGTPFEETIISRDPKHGKPCYIPRPPSKKIDYGKTKSASFNVSHQAGLVALIAIPESNLSDGVDGSYDVGVDIVCVDERGDLQKIMEKEDPRKAYNDFIEMHAEVFSPREIGRLLLAGRSVGRDKERESREIENGLGRFFALWCLREAYVKMTGEALLAEWLQELEFSRFPVPEPVDYEGRGDADGGELVKPLVMGEEQGEGFEIYFRGVKVKNVEMRILRVGKRHMVASAVRRKDGKAVDVLWTNLEEIGIEEVVRRAKAAV